LMKRVTSSLLYFESGMMIRFWTFARLGMSRLASVSPQIQIRPCGARATVATG
jgi:hypothetical protein